MPTTALHAVDGPVDARGDHAALTGTHGLTLLRASSAHAQLLFDTIEVLDLEQHQAGVRSRWPHGTCAEHVPSMPPG